MPSYSNMEEVLKTINAKYITLNTDQVVCNNKLLKSILENMVSFMKKDVLFKTLYEKTFYGGSYYDDLKVGRPDEFDLDLLMVLPKQCEAHKSKSCGCVSLVPSNKPGFFWFKVKENYYKPINKFISDGYMQTDKILNWLKSLVTTALNQISQISHFSLDQSPSFYSESGPALTLRICGSFGAMKIDLVPSFKFGLDFWPKEGYKRNPTMKPEFFIVPKKPKGTSYGERYWRPSFQEQERELIEGKQRLKPALRLLKKMRDNLNHTSISSYALKTIVLWEVDTQYFDWNATLSDTFMKLLEKYQESLYNKKIEFYWNKRNNLLDSVNPDTLTNHHNEIRKKINMIKNEYTTNPLVIAKIILKEGSNEYNQLMEELQPQLETFSSNSLFHVEPSSNNQNTLTSTSNGILIAGGLALGAAAIIGSILMGFRRNTNQ